MILFLLVFFSRVILFYFPWKIFRFLCILFTRQSTSSKELLVIAQPYRVGLGTAAWDFNYMFNSNAKPLEEMGDLIGSIFIVWRGVFGTVLFPKLDFVLGTQSNHINSVSPIIEIKDFVYGDFWTECHTFMDWLSNCARSNFLVTSLCVVVCAMRNLKVPALAAHIGEMTGVSARIGRIPYLSTVGGTVLGAVPGYMTLDVILMSTYGVGQLCVFLAACRKRRTDDVMQHKFAAFRDLAAIKTDLESLPPGSEKDYRLAKLAEEVGALGTVEERVAAGYIDHINVFNAMNAYQKRDAKYIDPNLFADLLPAQKDQLAKMTAHEDKKNQIEMVSSFFKILKAVSILSGHVYLGAAFGVIGHGAGWYGFGVDGHKKHREVWELNFGTTPIREQPVVEKPNFKKIIFESLLLENACFGTFAGGAFPNMAKIAFHGLGFSKNGFFGEFLQAASASGKNLSGLLSWFLPGISMEQDFIDRETQGLSKKFHWTSIRRGGPTHLLDIASKSFKLFQRTCSMITHTNALALIAWGGSVPFATFATHVYALSVILSMSNRAVKLYKNEAKDKYNYWENASGLVSDATKVFLLFALNIPKWGWIARMNLPQPMEHSVRLITLTLVGNFFFIAKEVLARMSIAHLEYKKYQDRMANAREGLNELAPRPA
jgi:hypothetical protein